MTSLEQYPVLIFDVGDVLIHYRWRDMLQDYGMEADEATRVGFLMFDDPEETWRKFDRGELTVDETIAYYMNRYPEEGEIFDWFIRHGEFMHVARPRVWKLVHALKEKGHRIYLLSNYSEYLFKRHTQYADFLEDLDGIVVSYMVGLAKPEPEIYQTLLERYQLNASDCLFFDDRLENVEAAEAQGIAARQVTGQEQLIEMLNQLLADHPV